MVGASRSYETHDFLSAPLQDVGGRDKPGHDSEVAAMAGQIARPPYTSRLCSTAAPTKEANSGWGSNGRDLSSGWNCTPMNQGWFSYSIISGSTPSGDMAQKRMPCCSSLPR